MPQSHSGRWNRTNRGIGENAKVTFTLADEARVRACDADPRKFMTDVFIFSKEPFKRCGRCQPEDEIQSRFFSIFLSFIPASSFLWLAGSFVPHHLKGYVGVARKCGRVQRQQINQQKNRRREHTYSLQCHAETQWRGILILHGGKFFSCSSSWQNWSALRSLSHL